MKKRHKALIITLSCIGGLAVILAGAFFIYTGIYYHSEDVSSYLQGSDDIEVREDSDNIYFIPTKKADSAVIFYPGAKVEARAYSPLCYSLAQSDIACYIVKMPFNLAVLSPNKGIGLVSDEYEHWYMAGHSLGGAMAATALSKNIDLFDGIFFLAAYSTADLSSTNLKTATIHGSNDGVLKKEKFNQCLSNLPSSNKDVVIEGGNHAGFAYYGPQSGDGENTIGRDVQISMTCDVISSIIKG